MGDLPDTVGDASRSQRPGSHEGHEQGLSPAHEWRIRDGRALRLPVQLAVETPIALQYNGVSHAVMLASPCDLGDFGLGFSLAEGILERASDLYGLEIRSSPMGVSIEMDIAAEPFARLKERRRTLAGRTGCGLCGTESLDQVIRPMKRVEDDEALHMAAIRAAVQALPGHQVWGAVSGAHHAAAWCSAAGAIELVREDVGRHNALDKLIGAMAVRAISGRHGFICVTSRASVEMVQKAVTAGVRALVAVSGPTSLACERAQAWGLTLIGFARKSGCAVYTHPQRVTLNGRAVA